MAVNHDIANKLQIMAKLNPVARLNTPANTALAPGSDGLSHPFDVVGTTATTPRAEAFRNIPSVAADFDDTSPVPTQDELDRVVGLPTLDSFEANVENFYLALNSANESLLVDEVAIYPKRRVDEMGFVMLSKDERLATKPKLPDPHKAWRPSLDNITQNYTTVNPRITLLRPNLTSIHHPEARRPTQSGTGLRHRNRSDEDNPENRPPKRFSLEYRTHANNAVMVLSSSSTPPNQIQTITKAGSNIRLAICILYRWFSNPLRDIAAIINKTFATGLSGRMCERILRGAKIHKLEEYIDVYEKTGRTEFNSHHNKVLRYLCRSAASIGVPLVPREEDVKPAVIRPIPTTSVGRRA